MSNAGEYVDLRVRRLKKTDLERKPNKWLAALPQFKTAESLLDIACGMGYDSIAWARCGKKVTGIDFNTGLLTEAARLAANEGLEIEFTAANATQLPFENGTFDFCISENLFEHVPNWQQIVSEANRVLREGGVFFVRTSNRICPFTYEINHMYFYPWLPEAIKRPFMRWIQRNKPGWINYSRFPAVNWFTPRSLAKALRAHGFVTCEVFDLVERELLSEKNRRFFFLLRALKKYPFLRYLAYLAMTSSAIIAVKPRPVGADLAIPLAGHEPECAVPVAR
jgi:ubiquinone/menaquinone biosynthesis C-methylase UbiE